MTLCAIHLLFLLSYTSIKTSLLWSLNHQVFIKFYFFLKYWTTIIVAPPATKAQPISNNLPRNSIFTPPYKKIKSRDYVAIAPTLRVLPQILLPISLGCKLLVDNHFYFLKIVFSPQLHITVIFEFSIITFTPFGVLYLSPFLNAKNFPHLQ